MHHTTPSPTIDDIFTALARLRAEGVQSFRTIDGVRKVEGRYLCDTDTPVKDSWNAEFGRMMSSRRGLFGIRAIKKKCRARDDEGRKTTSYLWEFIH